MNSHANPSNRPAPEPDGARPRQAAAAALALAPVLALAAPAAASEIAVQSSYPPLQFTDALPGGAHPIGGVSKAFVDHANAALAPFDIRFVFHSSGNVNRFDAGDVQPALVDRRDWNSLHEAVAAGPDAGGLAATVGIPANSGLAFGEYYSGGVPFGLTADEFIAYLYEGGGLDLQQTFYDEAFGENLVVIPIAVTPAQGSGFFPEPIPAPGEGGSPEEAMAAFCRMPLVVRYPGGAQAILEDACRAVGEDVDRIGRATRCADPKAPCGPNHPGNAVEHTPERLTFGGFAPGVIPHTMFANGNIDAFELNLPSEHVQFLKLAAGEAERTDAEADLSGVAPPYHYGTSWHQPWLYAELVVNRGVWEGLPAEARTLIELAARSAVLSTFANRLDAQGEAVARLTAAGVTHLAWPPELVEQLARVADGALDREAAKAAEAGDDTMARMLDHMRAYAAERQTYFDYDDVTQGRAATPVRP